MSIDTTIALASVAEAKVVLKIPALTTSEDTIMEDLINRASAFANTYTGRKLLEASYTEYYHGDGSDSLMTKQYPIGTLTSIYDDPLRAWSADTEILSADRLVDKPAGIIRLWNNKIRFLNGKANIRVIYTGGYPSASIPHDLKDAILMIVQHHYKRIYQEGRIGLSSESVGDQTFTYSEEAIPKKAKEILNRYRSRYAPGFSHV